MARLLWCRNCAIGYASVGGDVPTICPQCATTPARWTTMAPVSDVPRIRWRLTYNDRRFLKALKIAAN